MSKLSLNMWLSRQYCGYVTGWGAWRISFSNTTKIGGDDMEVSTVVTVVSLVASVSGIVFAFWHSSGANVRNTRSRARARGSFFPISATSKPV